MNKEHYIHICERYNLIQFHLGNSPDNWSDCYEGSMRRLDVQTHILGNRWDITDADTGSPLFWGIPSCDLAEDILSYIEQTRVLFA